MVMFVEFLGVVILKFMVLKGRVVFNCFIIFGVREFELRL